MISGEETIADRCFPHEKTAHLNQRHRQLRLSSQISEQWPMLGEFGMLPETPNSVGEREDNVW